MSHILSNHTIRIQKRLLSDDKGNAMFGLILCILLIIPLKVIFRMNMCISYALTNKQYKGMAIFMGTFQQYHFTLEPMVSFDICRERFSYESKVGTVTDE